MGETDVRRIQDNMKAVPISEITQPRDGYIAYMNRWWLTDEAGNVFFYRGKAPQCNSSREVAEWVCKRLGFGGVIFLELAFIENHSCESTGY